MGATTRKLIGILVAFAAVCPTPPAMAQDAAFVRDVFNRINEQRTQRGLGRLTYNNTLENAAQAHAEWMAREGKMEHLQPQAENLEDFRSCNHHPINRAINAGYLRWDEAFRVENTPTGQVVHAQPAVNDRIGEIIAGAWNAGHPATQPARIVNGWMNSPGHRQEILTGRYREMGIGVACPPGAKDTFWCVVFGDPGK